MTQQRWGAVATASEGIGGFATLSCSIGPVLAGFGSLSYLRQPAACSLQPSLLQPHQWWHTGGPLCLCGVGAAMGYRDLHPRHTSYRSRGSSPRGDCDTVCRSVTASRRSSFREGASGAWHDPRARATARVSTGGARLTLLPLVGGGESRLGAGGAALFSPTWRGERDCQVPPRRSCLSLRRGAAGPEWRRAPRTHTLALGQPPGQLLARGLRGSCVHFPGLGEPDRAATLHAHLCAGVQVSDVAAARVLHGCKVARRAAYP